MRKILLLFLFCFFMCFPAYAGSVSYSNYQVVTPYNDSSNFYQIEYTNIVNLSSDVSDSDCKIYAYSVNGANSNKTYYFLVGNVPFSADISASLGATVKTLNVTVNNVVSGGSVPTYFYNFGLSKLQSSSNVSISAFNGYYVCCVCSWFNSEVNSYSCANAFELSDSSYPSNIINDFFQLPPTLQQGAKILGVAELVHKMLITAVSLALLLIGFLILLTLLARVFRISLM